MGRLVRGKHLGGLFAVHDIAEVSEDGREDIAAQREAHKAVRRRDDVRHAGLPAQQSLLAEKVGAE